jgi:hypothetical protein
MHPRRIPVVLSLIAAASLLAACSGAASSGAPAATTPGALATTVAATTNPEASVDVGGAATGLSNLSSYKITMQLTGDVSTLVEIIAVNGATPARQVTTTSGSEVIRIVEIGSDVWVDSGTGTFVKDVMTKAQADAMLGGLDPGTFMANINKSGELGAMQNKGTEQKNGVNATHLHADDTTPVPAGASPIPAGAVADLWVAVDGGYLVALEATGFGGTTAKTDISMEVTNINDPTLSVAPPS